MSELDDVFRKLKETKICKSQYAFSRDFLGRAPNYFSAIKASNKKPSTHTLMTLHLALYERATHLNEPDNYADYHAKQSLISLSNEVLSAIKVRCGG